MRQGVGRVISFYSFKGGVGRTMALANIAALLCTSGKTVLVVDWDLEAPGLHKFFEKYFTTLKNEIASKPGILDIIYGSLSGEGISWRECVIEIKLSSGSLDLLSAGRADFKYRNKLQHLNWQQLYDEFNIGDVFEEMRSEWKEAYDYILLDSRTGVTDIGDVCTALFPDLLVTVFVANEQNVEGTKLAIERARAVHGQLPRDRTKLLVLPLMGRDESYTEYELSTRWREYIKNELSFTLADWMPNSVESITYFNKIFIPYYSYWSFGENLPVVERSREVENPASISAAYARISSLIESNLDWSVLEQGINDAEANSLYQAKINSLREKLSIGEAELERAREAEAKRIEQIEAYMANDRSIKRVRLFVFASFIMAIVSIVLAFLTFNSYKLRDVAYQSARQAEDTLSQQKSDFKQQIGELQTKNKELLDTLTKTTASLEQQNADAARQIGELQQQNGDLFNRLAAITTQFVKEQLRLPKLEQERKAKEEAEKAAREAIQAPKSTAPKPQAPKATAPKPQSRNSKVD